MRKLFVHVVFFFSLLQTKCKQEVPKLLRTFDFTIGRNVLGCEKEVRYQALFQTRTIAYF